MSLTEYIQHKNQRENEDEDEDNEQEDTMEEEIENKINPLIEICKENDLSILNKMKF